MADNNFEMTRSLGQTRYIRFDEIHNNENLIDPRDDQDFALAPHLPP